MHIPAAITFFQRVNNPSRAFWNWCASVAHHSISRSAPQREELFFYKQAQSQQGSGLDISRHLGSNLARGCMGGEWVYSSLEGATPYPPSVRRTCMGSWRSALDNKVCCWMTGGLWICLSSFGQSNDHWLGINFSGHLWSDLARGCVGGEWVYSSLARSNTLPSVCTSYLHWFRGDVQPSLRQDKSRCAHCSVLLLAC